MHCSNCKREFNVSEQRIIELIHPEELDAETRRELEGNTLTLTPEQARWSVLRENARIMNQYYWRERSCSIKKLAASLKKIDISRVFFWQQDGDVIFFFGPDIVGLIPCIALIIPLPRFVWCLTGWEIPTITWGSLPPTCINDPWHPRINIFPEDIIH